jgi:hypothetical protein
MSGKKEFSAVVVKASRVFSRLPVPGGESGQSCGPLELEGYQYGAWLISERSYQWAADPRGSTARSGIDFRVKAQAVNSNAV